MADQRHEIHMEVKKYSHFRRKRKAVGLTVLFSFYPQKFYTNRKTHTFIYESDSNIKLPTVIPVTLEYL